MLSIVFQFVHGRYHATPWGRHVNEGDVEWPPSPWRILRTLIATSFTYSIVNSNEEDVFRSLLRKLASSLPCYRLPETAIHSHTRHYMPVLEGRSEKNALVFDAFIQLRPGDRLIVGWPIELNDKELDLIRRILPHIKYLGRAESEVFVELLDNGDVSWNVLPLDEPIEDESGEIFTESIQLLVPLTPEDYDKRRISFLKESEKILKKKKRELEKIKIVYPQDWLEALCVSTGDLHQARIVQPPASRWQTYQRPVECIRTHAGRKTFTEKMRQRTPSVVRFAVYGKPLPRIESTVRFAEWFKEALLSQAKKIYGADNIPSTISGHGENLKMNHTHAFYLPEDADDDGYIDHVLIYIPSGIDDSMMIVLNQMRRIYKGGLGEWYLCLERTGSRGEEIKESRLLHRGYTWRSVTPYLHPWFAKKRFTVKDQIEKECTLRGYPPIKALKRIRDIRIRGRSLRPLHFIRTRRREGLRQPDRRGSFWQIEFEEPIQGPLALGFGCHYGLGLFACMDEETEE